MMERRYTYSIDMVNWSYHSESLKSRWESSNRNILSGILSTLVLHFGAPALPLSMIEHLLLKRVR